MRPPMRHAATTVRHATRRFGRFPHRNPILGRPMTEEEQQYLDNGRTGQGRGEHACDSRTPERFGYIAPAPRVRHRHTPNSDEGGGRTALYPAIDSHKREASSCFWSKAPTRTAKAERYGLEGVVSKRRAAPYQSGESRDWLKVETAAFREANRGGGSFKRANRRSSCLASVEGS
jgi:Bacterial protein of unknown function (DUF924)